MQSDERADALSQSPQLRTPTTVTCFGKVSNTNSAIRIEETANIDPRPVCGSPTTHVGSFADLYKKYFSFVWSIARHLGVEKSELDDVVQDIFVKIFERIDTLKQPESLRSWVYGIVRRIVSEYHRNKRTTLITTQPTPVEPELLQPEWVTPERLAEQSELAQLLWSLLGRLNAARREVFVLAELEEMTAPEIAAAIGVPLNTVYSRLRVARQDLEEARQRHYARTSRPEPRTPAIEALDRTAS